MALFFWKAVKAFVSPKRNQMSGKPYRGDGDRKEPLNNHKNPRNTSAVKKKVK
jgi:hypothetical protein